jgi:hypothetical protein
MSMNLFPVDLITWLHFITAHDHALNAVFKKVLVLVIDLTGLTPL